MPNPPPERERRTADGPLEDRPPLLGTWPNLYRAVLLNLAGLILLFIFRREAIRRPIMFRWACNFFVLSVVLPPFLYVVLPPEIFSGASRGFRNSGYDGNWLMGIPSLAGPLFLGISMLLFFSTLEIGTTKNEREVKPQPKHPLDD